MKNSLHPEFADLLDKARTLTPEQEAEAERLCREQIRAFRDWLDPLLRSRVVGATTLGGWTMCRSPFELGRYEIDHRGKGYRVLISGSVKGERRWIHLSFSRGDRVPDWEELKAVKSRFLGDDALAIQVFPPKEEWVNVHPYCLHLWSCVDGSPLPDFREQIGPIVSI
jgi:hypothetical protein